MTPVSRYRCTQPEHFRKQPYIRTHGEDVSTVKVLSTLGGLYYRSSEGNDPGVILMFWWPCGFYYEAFHVTAYFARCSHLISVLFITVITSLGDDRIGLYGPGRAKTCLMSYANNEGADQPEHPRCLISAFVVRSVDSIISVSSRSEFSRF